jgi:hypothetical protein
MYRYDDTITCEWNPRADELEQRIDDAAAFLQKVINAVYSDAEFNADEFHDNLEECAFYLGLKVPAKDLHIARAL